MKTSNFLINLMYAILTVVAMFLIGLTFTVSLEEAQQAKADKVQQH